MRKGTRSEFGDKRIEKKNKEGGGQNGGEARQGVHVEFVESLAIIDIYTRHVRRG